MRNIKYILLFVLSVGLLSSCLDQTTTYDANGEGPNVAGFELTTQGISAIADGDVWLFDLKVKLIGPTSMDVNEDITLNIGYDAEMSTAIEGTHFSLDNTEVILRADNNHLALFSFSMLTQGIETPLDESPVLYLTITDASGNNNVLPNGKPLKLTLNYACPSFLAGVYDVEMERTHYADGSISTYTWTEEIFETGLGEYRTTRVGHWTPAALGGTPGFTFTDVCDVLSIPGQNLVDLYSNWVEGTSPGVSDTDAGTLYFEYSICAAYGCYTYKATYTKQ